MIEYLKDMLAQETGQRAAKIENFPYISKGPIAIITENGKKARCPAWGAGKEIIKFDRNYIYVKSDNINKIDVFDEMGIKVKEIKVEDLRYGDRK